MADVKIRDLKEHAIVKCFAGHMNPLDEIVQYDGNPNGVLTASFKNQICYDYTNNNFYINKTNATTWTIINY